MNPKAADPTPYESLTLIPKEKRKKKKSSHTPIESTSPTPVDPLHTTPNPSLAYTSPPLFRLFNPIERDKASNTHEAKDPSCISRRAPRKSKISRCQNYYCIFLTCQKYTLYSMHE